VRSKQYCILNKQYSKEEYEALVPRIIEHMNESPYVDKKGREYRYGDFMPPELSPYAYNESIAQDYFPLTREQAIERGYPWRDAQQKQYEVTSKAEDLPDHIRDVEEGILAEVIGCQHDGKCNDGCSTAFKITDNELTFYQKMEIPLPRLCFNCRFVERLQKKLPMRLFDRACAKCGTEMKTSYGPDRPEVVYCEQCYQAEVV
jgi:ferredoxin